MKQKTIILIIINLLLYILGFYIVSHFGNWKITLGIIIILTAMNIENSRKFISK